MGQEKKNPSKKTNIFLVIIVAFILFAVTVCAGFYLKSVADSEIRNSSDSGTPADISVTERLIAELDDSYLIRDGKSFVLIKPVPIGVLIYRDRDSDGYLDHVSSGTVSSGELEIQGGDMELSQNSSMRKTHLKEFEDSLEVY